MYLTINGERHSVSKRIVTADTIRYLSVEPAPKNINGAIQMYTDEGFLLSEDNADEYERREYVGTLLTITNAPIPEPVEPVPQPPKATDAETLAAVSFARMMLPTAQLSNSDVIIVQALYDMWEEGEYKVGDIRRAFVMDTGEQPWKCRQAHDTSVYPDITPSGSAWRTFWIPFHGTTPETALPWVVPTMAEDMYKSGEYMIWTDGKTYKCKSDTNYNPEEYAQAWEVVENG